MKNQSIKKMTSAALLIALGVIIPMFSPVKIVLEPASFTLASHVPIFMAMFISPATAIAVTIGTTLGFFLGGFPIVVVLRAASHILFVSIGAYYLHRFPQTTESPVSRRLFSLVIGLVHTLAEVIVVSFFYFGNNMGEGYYKSGFVYSVILLVGLGGLVHSMVDFEIAWGVTRAISKQGEIAELFGNIKLPSAKKTQEA